MRNASTAESRDGRMHRRAAERHGVITRQELLCLGFSPAAITRRVKEGTLVRLRPRIYRVKAVPPSWLQALYAVCRWLEPHVVTSHRAAAAFWQVGDVRSGLLEVTTPTTGRRAPDVTIHTTDEMPPSDRWRRNHIPVTNPTRAVIDCCAVLSPDVAQAVMDDACHKYLTTPDRLLGRLDDMATRGRDGSALARKLVLQRMGEREAPESRLIRYLLRLLQRSPLPNPASLFPVRLPNGVTIHPDLGYPWLKIAIEADGWKDHGKPAGWQGDRDRDNPLQSHGWIVLRFTWADVTTRPDYVIDTVRDALRGRGLLV